MFDIEVPTGVGVGVVRRGDELPLLPEERSLVSEKAIESRRSDIALGRTAARLALTAAGLETGPIGRGPLGEPLWPGNAVGSITHAAGWGLAIAAAAEDARGIGVDLESRDRYFADLPDQIAFHDELRWLDRLTATDRITAALEVFAVKEAIYKAVAPRFGQFFGFDAVRVEQGESTYRGRLVENLGPDFPAETILDVRVRWHDDLVVAWLVLPSHQPRTAVNR